MLLLAVVLSLAAAQGCAKEEAQAFTEDGKPIVTLNIVMRLPTQMRISKNPMLDYIRDKVGFDLRIEAPPLNNYSDRLNIIMSSGDLPDIVYLWNSGPMYEKWAEDGLLNPVDDLIKDYPDIMRNVTPGMLELWQVPSLGKTYGVPRPNYANRIGMMVNLEFLRKWGMDAPSTVDEFYAFGKYLATGDPDGNGQNDTFLYSPVGLWADRGVIMDAFLPSVDFGVPDFDGVYKIREKMDGYYPYLTFMRKLYAEKILDPEYFINKTYDDINKGHQGRVAIWKQYDGTLIGDSVVNNGGKFDKWGFYPPIKNAEGKAYNYVPPSVWGVFALPTSSKKTKDALRFLDWGNSAEGVETLLFGVKGLTYNDYDITTRTLDITEEQAKLVNDITSTYMSVTMLYDGEVANRHPNPEYVKKFEEDRARYLASTTEVFYQPVNLPEYTVFQQDYPDLITEKTKLENDYVVGKIDRAALESFINTKWLPKTARYEKAYLDLMASRQKGGQQ
jgi:ABC-type glycerol-3-phosphate transport system substrate-binding protein